MAKAYQIDTIGGNCPVQAEGMIGGKTEFYFRSRGESWSMSIGPRGSDIVGNPQWFYQEDYGVWPEAGWISTDKAREFIDRSIKLYWDGVPTRKRP